MKVRAWTLLAVACVGCAGPSSDAPISAEDFPVVACTVAYRSAVTEPLQSTEEVSLRPGETETLTFDEAAIDLTYDFSEQEGATMRIDARQPGAEHYLSRGLYQFIAGEPPDNAFAGGHGFTGLVYIQPPDSTAEAQYFCQTEPAE
ncbi:MAG: hypothetical protein GEU81_08655 [Nitriliruptorales bacterium]|nr:hypothetical protein [Nitriliruptorales bacterium]